MEITAAQVKILREKTSAGLMDCKKALEEANGNEEEAIKILRTKGQAKAEKKSVRVASEGRIFTYIHHSGKLAVMIELNCETDFVAKNEEFQSLGTDIAMHVAASDPQFIKPEEVSEEFVKKEREIYTQQALNEGKPEKIVEKIVDGKIAKRLAEVCLVQQPFVKDPEKTVGSLITEKIAKLGENIVVRKMARFKVGE